MLNFRVETHDKDEDSMLDNILGKEEGKTFELKENTKPLGTRVLFGSILLQTFLFRNLEINLEIFDF